MHYGWTGPMPGYRSQREQARIAGVDESISERTLWTQVVIHTGIPVT
jgi:hypothetical protein